MMTKAQHERNKSWLNATITADNRRNGMAELLPEYQLMLEEAIELLRQCAGGRYANIINFLKRWDGEGT